VGGREYECGREREWKGIVWFVSEGERKTYSAGVLGLAPVLTPFALVLSRVELVVAACSLLPGLDDGSKSLVYTSASKL
jgi:hypothetical protein